MSDCLTGNEQQTVCLAWLWHELVCHHVAQHVPRILHPSQQAPLHVVQVVAENPISVGTMTSQLLGAHLIKELP